MDYSRCDCGNWKNGVDPRESVSAKSHPAITARLDWIVFFVFWIAALLTIWAIISLRAYLRVRELLDNNLLR